MYTTHTAFMIKAVCLRWNVSGWCIQTHHWHRRRHTAAWWLPTLLETLACIAAPSIPLIITSGENISLSGRSCEPCMLSFDTNLATAQKSLDINTGFQRLFTDSLICYAAAFQLKTLEIKLKSKESFWGFAGKLWAFGYDMMCFKLGISYCSLC